MEITVTVLQMKPSKFQYATVIVVNGAFKSNNVGTTTQDSMDAAKKMLQAMIGVPPEENPWVPTAMGFEMKVKRKL